MNATAAPLLITTDEILVAETMRLAAAAGVTPQVIRDVPAAWRHWTAAPIVLVGADLADAVARSDPPRRARVHVIGVGDLPDRVFREALAVGAESVATLPASDSWLVEQLTDAGDGGVVAGQVTGVIGGSGGAGATVWACALAGALADLTDTVLVDLDPYGAGVEQVLGLDRLRGVRWDALMTATGRLSARSLRQALPRKGRLALLAWPAERPPALPQFAAREVVSAAVRGYRHVVLDLPRQPDAAAEEMVARCDQVALVVNLTVAGLVAATRVARRLADSGADLHVVARGREVPAEEAARVLGLPVRVTMADQRNLDEAVALGAGPVRSRRSALARSSSRCARDLVASQAGPLVA